MATFGERFKELRIEKRLTQEKLADMFFTKKASISRYENNVNIPEIEALKKFADFFDVSIDYLLGRTDVRNHTDRIADAIKDDPELIDFWETLKERPELQLLFKQTKYLTEKDINQVIRIIKAIEDEEEREGN